MTTNKIKDVELEEDTSSVSDNLNNDTSTKTVTTYDNKDNVLVIQDVSKDPLLNTDVFKNRRKMAWLSLIGIFMLTGVLITFLGIVFFIGLSDPIAIKKMTVDYKTYLDWSGSFIGWTYATLSGVILAYFGVAAYFYNGYLANKKNNE